MENPVADPGPAGVQALVPAREVFQASVQEFGGEVHFQRRRFPLVKTVASYHALLYSDLKFISNWFTYRWGLYNSLLAVSCVT